MKTITLAAPWSHHTMEVTTDYQAGDHSVADDVYDAAVKAGAHKEVKDNGNGASQASPPRTTRKA